MCVILVEKFRNCTYQNTTEKGFFKATFDFLKIRKFENNGKGTT